MVGVSVTLVVSVFDTVSTSAMVGVSDMVVVSETDGVGEGSVGVHVPLAVKVQMSLPPDCVNEFAPDAVGENVPVGAEIITMPLPPAAPEVPPASEL